MRVILNAASAHMGGAVTYLKNVLRWLPIVAPEDRFIVYVPVNTIEKLGQVDESAITLLKYPFSKTSGAQRIYFDQVYLRKQIYEHKAELLYSTTGFGTFFSPCPQVLLVRNLAYFDHAFHAKYKELGRSLRKNTLRRWHSLLSIQRSDAILFPTQAMEGYVETYMNLGRKNTAAIPYGFDPDAFLKKNATATFPMAPDILRWKEKGYRLLLNVSTFAVQKNYETLVDAISLLAKNGLRFKLLTTISREITTDKTEYDALFRKVRDLGLEENVVSLGYIPYSQLGWLYKEADVYVFPSFTESFGHSMVEAMATGLPVVAADTPVNREVCGDAGLYFKPYDASHFASLLNDLLKNNEMLEQIANASLQRADHFSWADHTERLIQLFEAVRKKQNFASETAHFRNDKEVDYTSNIVHKARPDSA